MSLSTFSMKISHLVLVTVLVTLLVVEADAQFSSLAKAIALLQARAKQAKAAAEKIKGLVKRSTGDVVDEVANVPVYRWTVPVMRSWYKWLLLICIFVFYTELCVRFCEIKIKIIIESIKTIHMFVSFLYK